jgi:hypothetical protein
MTAILVVTIGTRDLMFQSESGTWYNIGNDRPQKDITIEQFEVAHDLKLPEGSTYREITKHLADNQDEYLDRLLPVIIGKLISDQAAQIQQLFLIGTDQPISVKQREKDSMHSCELIKSWVEKKHHISTTILPLCKDGTSPADFEGMFQWWRKTWQKEISPPDDIEIWLGLAGGVGQTSEAGRISGLSLYGDRIKFFNFRQDDTRNRAGYPSEYSEPFLGTNYLWDRTRQQAIGLLARYDYAGVQELLKPYTKGALPNLLRAAVAWNQGEFDSFLRFAKSTNVLNKSTQSDNWWWMAYEQAYLAIIRLEQDNTSEAMWHSFRAVEGGLFEWAKIKIGSNFREQHKGFPEVLSSLKDSYPEQSLQLKIALEKARGDKPNARWQGPLRREILEILNEESQQVDFQCFWSEDCQNARNRLSHRLGGISKKEVVNAWGTNDSSQWAARILACLNILTGKSFKTLQEASLFAKVQDEIKRSIELL